MPTMETLRAQGRSPVFTQDGVRAHTANTKWPSSAAKASYLSTGHPYLLMELQGLRAARSVELWLRASPPRTILSRNAHIIRYCFSFLSQMSICIVFVAQKNKKEKRRKFSPHLLEQENSKREIKHARYF